MKKINTANAVCGALIVALTMTAYLPVWHAGFIWDDDSHLTENPCIVGPLGFGDIWTSSRAVYYPLVLTTFWIFHKIFGLNPLPYHFVNVIIHAASAAVLWRVLRRLNVRGAWLGAALWTLHPVMVQSVAWITELKNTQSCLFYLLTILFFLQADKAKTRASGYRGQFGLALVFFTMAITSKPSTAMLPLVLPLCLWWQKRRLQWCDLAALVPFLIISLAASSWTIWEQRFHSGASGDEWAQSWLERLAIAGRDIWFYLGKIVWPHPLIFIYPRWKIDTTRLLAFLPIVAATAALSLLWFKRDGRLRPVFFAVVYFVITLFPVLGFFNVFFFRFSFVSDHFQYLASIGPVALAASGIVAAADQFEKATVWLRVISGGALLLIFWGLTWHTVHNYTDIETVFRATIQGNPACWMAHSNLGRTLLRKGKVDEAILHCQRALQIKPDYAEARSNLGFAFLQKGQVDEAISNYRKALKIKPAYAGTQNNLGSAFLLKGRVDEAIACYQRAIEIEPGYAEAHGNLCLSFLQKGELDKALAQCDIALQMKPALVETLSAGTRALELTRKVEGREFFVPINQRFEIYRRQHAYSQPGE